MQARGVTRCALGALALLAAACADAERPTAAGQQDPGEFASQGAFSRSAVGGPDAALSADVSIVATGEGSPAEVPGLTQSFRLDRRRESDGVWRTRISTGTSSEARNIGTNAKAPMTVERRDDEEMPRAYDANMRAIPDSPGALVRGASGQAHFPALQAMTPQVSRAVGKVVDRGFGGIVVEPATQAALRAFLARQGARAERTSRGSELFSFNQGDLRIALELDAGSSAILDESIWRGSELLSRTRREYQQFSGGVLVETHRLTEVNRPKASGGRLVLERTLTNVVLTGSGN